MTTAIDTSTTGSGSTAGTSKSATAQAAANVNFDTFLKLMTAQLQNQDPLNPVDGTQFTQQIASFSALEQQIQTNSNLEKLLSQQSFSQQSMAVGMIGKEVLAPGDKMQVQDGTGSFSYINSEKAATSQVEIFDASGARVGLYDGDTASGQHEFTWDGKDSVGNQLPDGEYQIAVSSYNAKGDKVSNQPMVYQKVTAVRSADDGSVYLQLDGGSEVLLDQTFSVRS